MVLGERTVSSPVPRASLGDHHAILEQRVVRRITPDCRITLEDSTQARTGCAHSLIRLISFLDFGRGNGSRSHSWPDASVSSSGCLILLIPQWNRMMILSGQDFRLKPSGESVWGEQNLTGKEFQLIVFGSKVYCTNDSRLLMKIILCSENHYQKDLD